MGLGKLFTRRKKDKHRQRHQNLCSVLNRHGVDLFLDVGANVGQTGRGLREGGYGGRIISVEPVKSCHDKLTAAAKDDPLWDVAGRCAAGESEGSVEIAVSLATDLSSLSAPTQALLATLPKAEEAQRETVPMRRIDGMFADEIAGARRTVLKIDTQGHDMAALRGAEGVMDKLHGVQTEMSLLPLYEGETLYLDILNYLHGKGFRPYLLTDKTFSKQLDRQLQLDGLFMRDAA
ncbi:MAG: FkbM family methyltransferase [Hyphomicrobiales bacterium]